MINSIHNFENLEFPYLDSNTTYKIKISYKVDGLPGNFYLYTFYQEVSTNSK